MRYTIVIERGPASYGAYVPDLPGCVAAAETQQEVLRLIREAIAFHLEAMREERRGDVAQASGLRRPPVASRRLALLFRFRRRCREAHQSVSRGSLKPHALGMRYVARRWTRCRPSRGRVKFPGHSEVEWKSLREAAPAQCGSSAVLKGDAGKPSLFARFGCAS